ncbi:MAG: 3TM-type holin [Gammaproteobacteria bacterium]|jgi:hypothetical protein
MGLFSWLIGGGAEGVGKGAAALADGVASAIDRLVETDEEKKAAEILRTKINQNPQKWQLEVNKVEAKHRSLFVAGWRPFVGWMCGFAFGWKYLGRPLIEPLVNAVAKLVVAVLHHMSPESDFMMDAAWKWVSFPDVDVSAMIPVLMGMLGLGILRTVEKSKGVSG